MKNKARILKTIGVLVAFLVGSQMNGVAAPSWFAAMQKRCLAELGGEDKVFEFLRIKDAKGVKITGGYAGAKVSLSTPGIGLTKLDAPGNGACCVFDNKGNIVAKAFETNGNDGCKSEKVLAEQQAPKNFERPFHSGIWWCVGPQANCFLDWSYQ